MRTSHSSRPTWGRGRGPRSGYVERSGDWRRSVAKPSAFFRNWARGTWFRQGGGVCTVGRGERTRLSRCPACSTNRSETEQNMTGGQPFWWGTSPVSLYTPSASGEVAEPRAGGARTEPPWPCTAVPRIFGALWRRSPPNSPHGKLEQDRGDTSSWRWMGTCSCLGRWRGALARSSTRTSTSSLLSTVDMRKY